MLSKACQSLSGVGPILAAKLAKCGLNTVLDLFLHLPYRYQDQTRITAIRDLRANDCCVIVGTISKTQIIHAKKRILECYVYDKTGLIKLRFFHFNQSQVKALAIGNKISVFGEVRIYNNQSEIIHPQYQLIKDDYKHVVEEYLTPIYPSTQGLTQLKLRQVIKKALVEFKDQLKEMEWMSEPELAKYRLHNLGSAIQLLHNPPPEVSLEALELGIHPAIKRLVFDELLAQNLSMQFARKSRQSCLSPAFEPNEELFQRFLPTLPFTLTKSQQRVAHEIREDLNKTKPMLRLLQGDVGSGKTIIAALAALQAIGGGYQVAFMAPTDLLAQQHSINLINWLAPLGISIYKLSAKMKTSDRQESLAALAANRCQLIVGTHALFQEEVIFARLGLVIIDEQHRFGVQQRLLLQKKGVNKEFTPHQLLMTATPIPRSLAMIHFAHLDLSIINELPPGRSPIITAIINQEKRELIIHRLQAAIAAGRQAYWVCTLIEESEKLQCIAATETAKELQAQLPCIRVGLIHGQMNTSKKEAIMAEFKAHQLDLLVATTVIEVGVDVPRASLMIIENAERLGLSQLHQLRGRVGRGSVQSHCLLLYQAPLSKQGVERLKFMRSTQDGFLIAEKDLELRGSGELLGTKQTGYKEFKIANIQRDNSILTIVLSIAKQLVEENPDTARLITERWLGNFQHFLQG